MSKKLPISEVQKSGVDLAENKKILKSVLEKKYFRIQDDSFDDLDFAFYQYDSVDLDSLEYKKLGMDEDLTLHLQSADGALYIDPLYTATFFIPSKVRVELCKLDKRLQPNEERLFEIVLDLNSDFEFLIKLISIILRSDNA